VTAGSSTRLGIRGKQRHDIVVLGNWSGSRQHVEPAIGSLQAAALPMLLEKAMPQAPLLTGCARRFDVIKCRLDPTAKRKPLCAA
jgi:hypothetical protein